jgi:tRNA pseudouridine55 synthase
VITVASDGFLVVDKPGGMTSHDVVSVARRALGTRKVGHAGTLDPMATGVLVLGFGNGTRLLQYITDGSKSYQATMLLGISTVSDDADGDVLEVQDASAITQGEIEKILATMRGEIEQRPSSVSAVKVNGKRAYDRVREGEDVQLASRRVTISELRIDAVRVVGKTVEVDIFVTCSAGTFIRAIARDCGALLGVGGHLISLRRTQVAAFGFDRSITLEALKSGDFTTLDLATTASTIFPSRILDSAEENELHFGRVLTGSGNSGITAGITSDGHLNALLEERDGKAHPIAVFHREQKVGK